MNTYIRLKFIGKQGSGKTLLLRKIEKFLKEQDLETDQIKEHELAVVTDSLIRPSLKKKAPSNS